jgi:uncharacterized protein (TIGR00299 family) protein
MNKILYLDCQSGISGDMSIGAFLDLGVDPEYLKKELDKLGLNGYELKICRKASRGISGTDFDVVLSDNGHDHDHVDGDDHEHDHGHEHGHNHEGEHCHEHEHHHSNWSEIKALIEKSSLSDDVKNLAVRIFQRVAEAEAKVHGVSVEEVHFHEVGAIDSIIDIVGAAVCFESIRPDRVVVSPMNTGSGTICCKHGILPVPAPATGEILAKCNAKIYSSGVKGELVTPTGAAIAAELADEFGNIPAMRINKAGYGTGKKDFGIPNILRMILGSDYSSECEEVEVLETNIDDMTGEAAGYTMDKLMSAGALDAFYTPIYMKKNRPAVKLSVICRHENVKSLEGIILAETTTIGLRKYTVQRTVMERKTMRVKLPYGEADVKICEYEGIKKSSPEYESVRKLAEQTGLSLIRIYQDIYGKTDIYEM